MLAVAGCGNEEGPNRLSVHEVVPAIKLQGVDRPDADVNSFRGKVLVMNVWATWCPPCRREMPSLARLQAKLESGGAMVIGVSVENDVHQVREWLRHTNIAFPNFVDTRAPSARDQLRITTYPQTFIVAPDGRLIARVEGARDWDEPKWLNMIRDASTATTNVRR